MRKKDILGKSTPNRITWIYYKILTGLVRSIEQERDSEKIRDKAVLIIFLALNLVETFVNVYFRVSAEKIKEPIAKNQILKEINDWGIEKKLREWKIFKKIDFDKGIGQKFMEMKRMRNDLVHFKPTYEEVRTMHGIILKGMTDTSAYDRLDKDVAIDCLKIAEDFIMEILHVCGCRKDMLEHDLHHWLGKVP